MLLNSHPIALTTVIDAHRADLMAEAERDRLWQLARVDGRAPGPGWPKRLTGKMVVLAQAFQLAFRAAARRAAPQTALGLATSRRHADRDALIATAHRDESRPGLPRDVSLPAD